MRACRCLLFDLHLGSRSREALWFAPMSQSLRRPLSGYHQEAANAQASSRCSLAPVPFDAFLPLRC